MARGENFQLRAFSPANYMNRKVVQSNLFNLSAIDLNWDRSLIRSSLAMGTTESNKEEGIGVNSITDSRYYDSLYYKIQDITRVNNDYIAFFDRDYPLRRDYLRNFAQNGEINSVLDTIADECIVVDENNFFAYLDLSQLEARLKDNSKVTSDITEGLQSSYNRVYQMFGWTESNDAWEYLKKLLVDGFLSFEILFEYDKNKQAKNIIGFKELDPTTLEPSIVRDTASGTDIKVWYQYKDDPEKERIIPDSNLIYISWAKGSFSTRISYLEGLTRTFNMLRQMENSRVIWNVQNSQKRIKIVVPIGAMTEDRARAHINELRAQYTEDVQMDDLSGELTVNGMPKFSFMKTYLFPAKEGVSTEISEMGVDGYDLNSVEQLKYWWRRFILETKIPANRFTLDPTSAPNNSVTGESSITREEYTFTRFIKRIQSIYKEILLKPIWVQFCLQYPLYAQNELIKSCLGLSYNQENIFELAKKREMFEKSINTITQAMNIKEADGKPYFAARFLIERFMDLTDEDIKLNQDYKLREAMNAIDAAAEAQAGMNASTGALPGGDMGMGGGMGSDMSMGADMGMGGGMGSPDAGMGGMTADIGMGAETGAPGGDMGGGMM